MIVVMSTRAIFVAEPIVAAALAKLEGPNALSVPDLTKAIGLYEESALLRPLAGLPTTRHTRSLLTEWFLREFGLDRDIATLSWGWAIVKDLELGILTPAEFLDAIDTRLRQGEASQ